MVTLKGVVLEPFIFCMNLIDERRLKQCQIFCKVPGTSGKTSIYGIYCVVIVYS